MKSIEQVNKKYNELKKYAFSLLKKRKWESLINTIDFCARFAYTYNHIFYDRELEQMIFKVSKEFFPTNQKYKPIKNRYVFYNSFGTFKNGLTRQYLNALKSWDVEFLYVYNSNNKKNDNNLVAELENYAKAQIFKIDKSLNNVDQVLALHIKISEYKPEIAFLHMTPWDVNAIAVFFTFNHIVRYQINITDHAFWLGVGICDYCIEFRNYGANISMEKREIEEKQLLFQPFYPIVKSVPFKGYPFVVKDNSVVIFSGGAYYKIYGNNYMFFELLKGILEQHQNVVMLYAGWGDSNPFKKFISQNNLHNRIYLLGHRADFNELMARCDIYLSTYPISGGLMAQYAAINAKPIIARINPERQGASTAELIGHNYSVENENLDFSNNQDFFDEISKLITNKLYREEKGQRLKKAVITECQFNDSLKNIVDNKKSNTSIKKIQINYSLFIEQCINIEMNHNGLLMLYAFRKLKIMSFKFFKFKLIKSLIRLTLNKFIAKFN